MADLGCRRAMRRRVFPGDGFRAMTKLIDFYGEKVTPGDLLSDLASVKEAAGAAAWLASTMRDFPYRCQWTRQAFAGAELEDGKKRQHLLGFSDAVDAAIRDHLGPIIQQLENGESE